MSYNSSSNFSSYYWGNIQVCLFAYTASFVGYILLLPLNILVLFMGFQRLRKQRAGATSEMASHSDIITYNMAAIEVFSVLGSCLFCYGIYTDCFMALYVGMSLWCVISPAQVLFHLLTCAERYLAVVHPVTYRGLKVSGGVRIRNISIGCVWLLSVTGPTIESLLGLSTLFNLMFMLVSLIIVCFCTISVLWVLLRTTPGETGSNRGRVDQSKRRVVHTIVAITGALLLKFLSNLVHTLLGIFLDPDPVFGCLISWCVFWFTVPSGLVLPLLFLQRAGKVPCTRHRGAST